MWKHHIARANIHNWGIITNNTSSDSKFFSTLWACISHESLLSINTTRYLTTFDPEIFPLRAVMPKL